MANKKYIGTKELAERTGRPYNEILNLTSTGVLPSHKSRKGHWRLNVDAVEKYFGIVINEPEGVREKPIPKTKSLQKTSPLPNNDTRLITNEIGYQEIIESICAAKSSIRIMTANFKRFNLKPTDSQGKEYKDGTPFIKYLMAKAVQGVSVQIICSNPSTSFTDEWKEYYRQMMNPTLFDYKHCIKNHAKVVIVDDKLVYIGSANVSPAGLGQGIMTPGNFEAGIMTEDPEVVESAKAFFSMVWDDHSCTNCHRAKNCDWLHNSNHLRNSLK